MNTYRSEKLTLSSNISNVNTPPEYAARDLTKNGEIAHISLQEKVYILRITRAGKLILTK
tara:strand:- start:406 stop:585 length:180 start_codon:yes stop_codon:yes gene_type:complete